MPRYIDANKLEELCDIMAEKCGDIGESIWKQFRTTVEWSPTADVVERKHGRWIRVSPARIYECSICGQNIMAKYIDCYKFCFGCGAKMDEVKDDLS